MKASRHNGRSGKHGSYNPKHNDRRFDPNHSEHINQEKMLQNIYWDCYHGHRTQLESVEKEYLSFEEVEKQFYEEQYSDFVDAQNLRNEMNRHPERNRSVLDLYQNKKTCPEESIYQLGNIDESVSAEKLMEITEDFLERFNERYGEHIHVIDWALHVDEATPHIHERHVFDAKNAYGELSPQQDKALEMLGIELPEPDKKKSKSNNRKIVFDAMVRKLFLDVCEEYDIYPEREASYGGRDYLEKQDFIIANQKHRIELMQKLIEEKEEEVALVKESTSAIEDVFESMAECAYDECCNEILRTVSDFEERSCMFAFEDGYKAVEDKLNGYEQSLIKKVISVLKDKVIQGIHRCSEVFKDYFQGRQYSGKGAIVNQIQRCMWNRMEDIAKDGIGDKREETQEIAEHFIRRRGR